MPGDEASVRSGEVLDVWHRRFDEAREAGLTVTQARWFADGQVDVGLLRRLVSLGCEPGLIARIVRGD